METSDRSTGQTSSPSTSSAAATRASPSLTRERVRASLTRAICGPRSPDAFAIYDPAGSCWKTSQATFHWASGPFSETWPRSGTMRGGTASPLRPSAPRTYATACSLWRGELLPTPTTVDTRTNPRTGPIERTSSGTLRTRTEDGRKAMLSLADLAMRGALLPTPTKSDGMGGPGRGKNKMGGDNLRTAVAQMAARGLLGQPGRLSPLFVEWMMGFPQRWTRLDSED